MTADDDVREYAAVGLQLAWRCRDSRGRVDEPAFADESLPGVFSDMTAKVVSVRRLHPTGMDARCHMWLQDWMPASSDERFRKMLEPPREVESVRQTSIGHRRIGYEKASYIHSGNAVFHIWRLLTDSSSDIGRQERNTL